MKRMASADVSAISKCKKVLHRISNDKLQTENSTTIIDNEEPIRHTEIIVETIEPKSSLKTSRKHLVKENIRLAEENKHLRIKFQKLENLSVKKICKLRDKVNVLQLANAHFKKDIEELEVNLEYLMYENEALKKKLETLEICQKCEEYKIFIDTYNNERKNYYKENEMIKDKYQELNGDMDMLKTVVFRLNMQLERYQELLRKDISLEPHQKRNIEDSIDLSKDILSENHKDPRHHPLSWGNVNKHTLGPLLDAYEEYIKEKDEIIGEYKLEINVFTGRMREVLDENERLYKKLTEDERCSSKLSVELEHLQMEMKNVIYQNDVLNKKCSLKQDKLEEVLKIYEIKVDQMTRDYNVLHGEYVKVKTENAAVKERTKICIDSQEELRTQMKNFIPVAIHNSGVNECKRWYEELKQQYEVEKEKLTKNIEDLKIEIGNLNTIKQKLENSITLQQKQTKKLETKQIELEHNLNGIELSRSALKKQLYKAMEFARDMVTEQELLLKVLNQMQLENKAVKKIGSDIASRMDLLKSQLKDTQKSAWQEFATVEKTIQEQAKTIESMKNGYEKEIDELKRVGSKETNIFKPECMSMAHYFLLKNK